MLSKAAMENLLSSQRFLQSTLSYLKGTCMNFIDQDLVHQADAPEGSLELLEIYYRKEHLRHPRAIKKQFDTNHLKTVESQYCF